VYASARFLAQLQSFFTEVRCLCYLLCLLLQAAEFWELGLEPFPVSAISGTGTGEDSRHSSCDIISIQHSVQ
jgi:hypothetical protein